MRRIRVPEVMDGPGLDAGAHRRALAGLARLHAVSRTHRVVWRTLRPAAEEGRLRVLDVACGRGDLLLRLAAQARRCGVRFEGLGVDRSELAIAEARQRASRVGGLKFERADVVKQRLPGGYDGVMSSLFLHHLDEEDAVRLLAKMQRAAGRLVLVEDLVRSWRGWVLAWVGSRALTRSSVVHTDALRSVRSAYRPDELLALARRAGWRRPGVRLHWPQRALLSEAVR